MGLFQVSLSVCCTSRSHNKGIPHASYWASSAKYWASLGSTTAHDTRRDCRQSTLKMTQRVCAQHPMTQALPVTSATEERTCMCTIPNIQQPSRQLHPSRESNIQTSSSTGTAPALTAQVGMQPSHVAVLSCLIVHTPTNQPTKQTTDRPTDRPTDQPTAPPNNPMQNKCTHSVNSYITTTTKRLTTDWVG